MTAANYETAFREVLSHEGGFVNHPSDPGGATNLGWSLRTLKALGIDLNGDGRVDISDVRGIKEKDARRLYKRYFWDAMKCDLLPSGVDYAVMDYGVNSGPKKAIMDLQRVLGVADDGRIGPITLAAVERHTPALIINALCDRRLSFLQKLSTWPQFGRGWSTRVLRVRVNSLEMIDEAPIYAPVSVREISLLEFLFNKLVWLFQGAQYAGD